METVKNIVPQLLVTLILLGVSAGMVFAAVTGDCVNCHTMHNSQDGAPVASTSTGNTTAQINLLNADCLGCHTNTASNETIVTLGTGEPSYVPIVLTAGEPTYPPIGSPTSTLAGGNFYWVNQGDDTKGHNVYGLLSGEDGNLDEAPGRGSNTDLGESCNDCHATLATVGSGCNGCHYAAHHKSGNSTTATDEEDGWYRFLTGGVMVGNSSIDGVVGIEDSKWEQDPTNHNIYKGVDSGYIAQGGAAFGNSIGAYCTGCHGNFHHIQSGRDGILNADGAWIRHPSDVVLPSIGEYSGYEYTALAPVAYEEVDTGEGTGDQLVTCISCHRPHGSPYSDMLRWDYDSCITNTTDTACGCFACHAAKDGIADTP